MNPWPGDILKDNYNKPTHIIVPKEILEQEGFVEVKEALLRMGNRGPRLEITGRKSDGRIHSDDMDAPDVNTYQLKTQP